MDAVARVAVNLRGVAVSDVGRGDVLLGPGRWHLTAELDVRAGHPRAVAERARPARGHRRASGAPPPTRCRHGAADAAHRPARAGRRPRGAARPEPARGGRGRAGARRRSPEAGAAGGGAAARRRARRRLPPARPPTRRSSAAGRCAVPISRRSVSAATTSATPGRSSAGWSAPATWRGWVDRAGHEVTAWAAGHPIDPAHAPRRSRPRPGPAGRGTARRGARRHRPGDCGRTGVGQLRAVTRAGGAGRAHARGPAALRGRSRRRTATSCRPRPRPA